MCTISFSIVDSEEINSEESPFQPGENHITPLIGKPQEIGSFSVDANCAVHFNKTQLKYLISPLKTRNLHINLNFGIDGRHNFVTLKRMHWTLQWLMHNCNSSSYISKTNFDFVTVRGTLRRVLCTPYLKGSAQEQWEICASKLGKTIYFSAIDTDVDIEKETSLTFKKAQPMAWGYKFEEVMTSETGNENSNSGIKQEEYCIVLKNVFEKYTVLYSAEIDAVIPGRHPGPGSGNTSCYTELKTFKSITSEGHSYYFHRYKLVNWWAQSFLTGIPEVICGVRDDEGIVNELKIFSVSKMPEEAMGLWRSDACLSFCMKFLNFLKRTVIEDDVKIVYRFHYRGGDTIYCTKLVNPIPRYRVIPDWFVKGERKI